MASPVASQEIPLSVVDTAGNMVCNEAGAYVPVPGYPGVFIGRVLGTPTATWCAGLNTPVANYATLGVFQFSLAKRQMVLQYSLATPPVTWRGTYVRTLYDPSVMSYHGQLWLAAECTPHDKAGIEHVSTCVMPLLVDGTVSLDTAHFTVPVQGKTLNGTAVSSASTPHLINWNGTPYLYWVSDGSGAYPIVTYGAELALNTAGEMWVVGSPGIAIDAQSAEVVRDIVAGDPLSNFQASVDYLYPAADGSGFYILSTLGGIAHGVPCEVPTAVVPGCWRMQVTFATSPLGYNVFAGTPLPVDQIPASPIGYPRPLIDPATGMRYLSASTAGPHSQLNVPAGYAPAVTPVNTALLPWPSDIP